MSDVTRILSQIENGDPTASEQLLPLVYSELRKLATARLANEKPGQTLQATALVHEAYIRLVGNDQNTNWNGRGHFFGAAAEAMRRILIDRARAKATQKRGCDWNSFDFEKVDPIDSVTPEQLLSIDEALTQLSREDLLAGELVKLRYFVGLSLKQAAVELDISNATAYRHWTYARAWLRTTLLDDSAK